MHFEGESISYSDVLERARRVVASVREHIGAEPGAVVLLVPQGIDQIAAILGVLEAGSFYVPLDVRADAAALRELLVRVDAKLVIATAATCELAAEVAAGICPIVRVDQLEAVTPNAIRTVDDPDALAYVYFTSGTTGAPKGVMDSHRNVLHNVLRYTNALQLDGADRLTLLQSAHFSGAVSNVFGALLNGATLLPYDVERSGAGAPLARWLEAQAPTVYHSVPSLFRGVCIEGASFPSVRLIRLEGDAGAPGDVERMTRHFSPAARLVHGLGTTETGICCQCFVAHGESITTDVLPVGYSVEDMEVGVIDEAGAPVPQGTVGEIVVRSRYLALGYWRDDARTERAFHRVPGTPGLREYRTGDVGRFGPGECLEHLGRYDLQLKLRGQWVDVAAVEARLGALPGVSQAVVAAHRESNDESTLAAYLVCEPGEEPSFGELHRTLVTLLPAHAVPTRAYALAALPLGPNGKLDRRALVPQLGRALREDAGAGPPRDAAEASLVAIWKRVLRREDVGIHDAFLELGGDSLAAVQVALEIEREFGGVIPHALLLETPTIAALAARLRGGLQPRDGTTVVPIRVTGSRSPVLCVHDMESDAFLFTPLARRLGVEQPLYGLRMPPGGAEALVPRTIEALASRYLADIERVAPHGPHLLVGFCFGGVVALEMARLLAERGQPVALLALINITAYDLPRLVSPAARARFRHHWGARLRYLRHKPDALRWVVHRVAGLANDLVWRLRLRAGRDGTAPASEAFVRATLRAAFRAHTAQPHAGDVVLVLADITLPLYADDPREAWAALASGAIDIRHVPLDGYAALSEPDVPRVAQWIAERLEDLRAPRRQHRGE